MLLSPLRAPEPMHIPDGFLSLPVSLAFWVLAVLMIAVALRQTRQQLGERDVPLMGVLAAAIFAGQMLNFTVVGGTSGHLLGGALAAILLGPWPAVIVMTCVVAVQALFFQDGGLVVLGANLFNMAIVGVFAAHTIYLPLRRLFGERLWGPAVAGLISGWASVILASLVCSLQLVLSGTSPLAVAVPAMVGIHSLIGVGEGLITAGALAFLAAVRRDLVGLERVRTGGTQAVLIGGGLIALVLAILSPLASSFPDGLEWVAEQHGFLERGQEAVYTLLPDYSVPGIADPNLTTIAAGVIGVMIVFGLAVWVGRVDRGRSSAQS